MSLQEMYNQLQNAMTDDLYDWLKTEYSDVCSNGDIIINNHLDNMYNNVSITELTLIDHIYNKWQTHYVNGHIANPWWAS